MDSANALEKPLAQSSKLWAIDLQTFATLATIEQNERKTRISVDLYPFDSLFKTPVQDLSISIGQKFPTVGRETIKSLAQSVKQFKSIVQKDCVISTLDSQVLDIGLVVHKEIDAAQGQAALEIHWLADVSAENFYLASYKRQAVSPIHPSDILGVEGNGQTTLENKLANLGYALVDQREEVFTKHSATFDYIDRLSEPLLPKDEKGGTASLFFATNRTKTTDEDSYFGNSLADSLTYGFCEVSIPKGHVQGKLERPAKNWFLEFPERESNHIVLKNVKEVDSDTFEDQVANWVSQTEKKSALLFVHGYNTTFEEAARRTGQLAWDIPFDGPAGFFSWPSSGKMLSYGADEEKSESSVPDFSAFLMQILQKTGVEQLHILAHSMGGRVLGLSLSYLSNDPSFKAKAHLIHQLVLGAPDIDQEKFKKTILPHFKTIGVGRTLYASDKDRAMQASHTYRGGRPRLGEAGSSVFVEEGLDTIEVSNMVSAGINHNYIFEVKELLTDLFYLLGRGMEPAQRRLKAIPKGTLRYWLFVK